MFDSKCNSINFYHGEKVEIVKGTSRHSFPKHSHQSFCIGLVIKGCLNFHINGDEFMLPENSVYLIPPFLEYTISSLDNMQYVYVVICLDKELIDQYSNALLEKYVYVNDYIAKKVFDIYQRFDKYQDQNSLRDDLIKVLEKDIIILCNPAKNAEQVTNSQVAEFIKEHLEEEVNLNEISSNIHSSKYHLIRQFKKQMGVTPYQYYIQEKIKKVEHGLEKEQPIEDLVYNLKFSDQSHLCNVFKKHVGVTPMQYKKSNTKINV